MNFSLSFLSVLQKIDPLGQPTKSAHPGTVTILLLVKFLDQNLKYGGTANAELL